MNYKIAIVSFLSLSFLFSCTHKVEGDIHPEIPELNDVLTDKIEIKELKRIETVQFAKNGDIHLFGYTVDSGNRKQSRMLWRYKKNFQLIDSIFITDNVHQGWFMDAASNVYIINRQYRYHKLSFPEYKPVLIPLHPSNSGIIKILDKEIYKNKQNASSDLYKELEKAGKLDEVERMNDEIAEELADYYEDNIPLKEIKFCYYFSGVYVLFMKNGSSFTLPSTQLKSGKSGISIYLKDNDKMRIYSGYHSDDWSSSIANLELKNAEYITETDFSVTASVSVLDNWPNPGYTRGYYYYRMELDDFNYEFKVKGSINKTIVREISKPRQDIFFIKTSKWYLVRRI